jgi:hypothetical protein
MKTQGTVKAHFRKLKSGKVVYVHDYHAAHEHADSEPAQLHERSVKATGDDASHMIRVVDAADRNTVVDHAKALGIEFEVTRQGATLHGHKSAYWTLRFKTPEDRDKVFQAIHPAEEKPEQGSVDDEFEKMLAAHKEEPKPEPKVEAAPVEPPTTSVEDEFHSVFMNEAALAAKDEQAVGGVDEEFDKLFGAPTPAVSEMIPTESPATAPQTGQKLEFIKPGMTAYYAPINGKEIKVDAVGQQLHVTTPFKPMGIWKDMKAAFPGNANWNKQAGYWTIPAECAKKMGEIIEQYAGEITHFEMPDGAQQAEEASAAPEATKEAAPETTPRLGDGDIVQSVKQVKVGMSLKRPDGNSSIVVAKDAEGVTLQEPHGILTHYATDTFDATVKKNADGSNPIMVGSTTAQDYKLVETDGTPKVGDEKTIGGVTYTFNANHRWEKKVEKPVEEGAKSETEAALEGLKPGIWTKIGNFTIVKTSHHSSVYLVRKNGNDGMPLSAKIKSILKDLHPGGFKKKQHTFLVDKDNIKKLAEVIDGKAAAPKKKSKQVVAPISAALPVYKKIPGGFPFEQIGPQKGSNPGGLYKDQFGKKWYIKFPETEDHAQNELLASQLYKMAGIAAPNLKLVSKDGKVGIASEFIDDLHAGSGKQLAGAAGAKQGFMADAWLANWDVTGLANDNMLLDKEGKAVRVDVGGALLYRAQGAPKGSAFGDSVSEIETLADPSKNPNSAAVFNGMTKEELDKSAIAVLSIPDSVILKAVEMWGPGGPAEKVKLGAMLLARKQTIAAKFPDANLIANPPAPDPKKLPVDASKLPGKVDFFNYGATGKPLSSSEHFNKANQATFDSLYAAAMKGDLQAFKDFQYDAVDKATGTSLGKQSIGTHPNKDIKAFYQSAIEHMENIAYPGTKIDYSHWFAKSVTHGDPQALAEAVPGHPFGITVNSVPKENRLGFWIKLGHIQSAEEFMPAKSFNVTQEAKKLVSAAYQKMPQTVKSWLGNVQGSGAHNIGDKEQHFTDYNKKMVQEAYDHAVEFPEGTIIRRWLSMPGDMIPQLQASEPGLVFQNPRSQCCSMNPSWDNSTHFGGGSSNGALLEIHYAKGAKGLPTAGSGAYSSEEEITSLPGQRYMLMKSEKHKSGRPKFTLLALPPDPGYCANPQGATNATA